MDLTSLITPDSAKPPREKLVFTTRLATPKDAGELRALREIAIHGEDAGMLGLEGSLYNYTVRKWRAELANSGSNIYYLASRDSKIIGMSFAVKEKRESGVWDFRYGFVMPEFRGGGVGKELFARRLRDVIERGGKKVVLTIRDSNQHSINIAESFGAEKDEEARISGRGREKGWQGWKIDLTKSKVKEAVDCVLKGK